MKRPGFTLVELVISVGLFMVAVSVALVATVGTNSLVNRTDARSAITESARSVGDALRRVAENAPVGSVALHGYYNTPDAFAAIQVKKFSGEQAQNTCEVIGRARAVAQSGTDETYQLDSQGDLIAYWIYRLDSGLQCPQLSTKPAYQNRLTDPKVRATAFELQINSYDCAASVGCATKQLIRYRFTVELLQSQSGRAVESRQASTTVHSSLPIGLVGSGSATVNIFTTALPDGAVGRPYYKEIIGEGGRHPYTWSSSGTLSAGLNFSQQGNRYILSGTPTATGVNSLTVRLSDGTSSDQQDLTFSINANGGALLRITTTALPIGVVGSPYTATLEATGGNGQLRWEVLAGALPPGLSLTSSTGVIGGTPTTPGQYPVTIVVRDSNNQTNTKAFTILIEPGGACVGSACQIEEEVL